jgi:hypothetical protein
MTSEEQLALMYDLLHAEAEIYSLPSLLRFNARQSQTHRADHFHIHHLLIVVV